MFECPSRGYVAVNKPFAVRLDTPRGWLETDVDGNRVENALRAMGRRRELRGLVEHDLSRQTPSFLSSIGHGDERGRAHGEHEEAAGEAAKLFRERKAKKTYLAVVFGWPEDDEWTVAAKLSKDHDDPKVFASAWTKKTANRARRASKSCNAGTARRRRQ